MALSRSAPARWSTRGAVLGAAFCLCAPLLMLALRPGEVAPGLWPHVAGVMLPRALAQTAALLLGVGAIALLLGVGAAWAVTRYDFPGRRAFEWLLALPMAFPAYVLAYAFVAGLSFTSPLARAWRDVGLPATAFPEIRSLPGATLVLGLALFPYIYLLMRASLLRHGSAAFDAARTLGATPGQAFVRVVLPATTPAWLGGLGLVLLETLADFGAVKLLGRDTLTTLIVQAWTGLKSLALAAQLSLAMLGGVLLVLFLARLTRAGTAPAMPDARAPRRSALSPRRAWALSLACAAVVAIGVGFPLLQLVLWLPPNAFDALPLSAIRGTVLIAGATALAAVALGTLFAAARRRHPNDPWIAGSAFAAGLGYAVPGAVMAIAVFWSLLGVERALAPVFAAFDLPPGGLSTGLFALVLALLMRFQRVGLSGAAAALAVLRPNLLDSAALLGHGRAARWWRIGLPVLRPGLLAAALLVFVEAMKELPATLMLRPFGWDTLAVEVYTATSEGLWAQAALPALLLVAVGLVPVALLMRERR
jgi:iron(III) transport system permease protein